MSKSRPPSFNTHIKQSIPAIYQNNFLEITVWAWICAQIHRDGRSITEACISYREFFKLTEDELSLSNLRMIYNRKNLEYRAVCRSEGKPIHITDDIHQAGTNAALEALVEIIKRHDSLLKPS